MKILIATDGSEFSRKAFEKASEIAANRKDVSLRVMAVYEPQVPVAAEPFALSADYFQELDAIGHDRAEDYAKTCVDYLKERCNGSTEIGSKVEIGRPAQKIVEEADRWGADLIVVGSHGHGFWGRLALGSVSDAVLHHSRCSVLVVK